MTNLQIKEALDALIANMREAYHVPSIMMSVCRNGETFFCGGGLANVEQNLPATPDTVYAIASASKAFIATSLCILCDEGKLALDRPVRAYLPEFTMYDACMSDHLTVCDALSHRSGLPRHDLMWLNQPELNIHEIIERLRYLPLAFEPRTRMHYQNHMFTLASVLVERVSGMPWQRFVETRIFAPLGMKSSYAVSALYRDKIENQSEPYAWRSGALCRLRFNNIENVGCAGSISSTVRDLARWSALQLGRGTLDGVRIYSEEMADRLHCPQMIIKKGEMFPYDFPEIDFTSYGMGWFIESYRGHKLVHHGGTIDGYKSLVGFLPREGVSFAVLTNLERNQTPAALGYALCDLALGLEPIDWAQRFLSFMNDAGAAGARQLEACRAAIAAAPPAAHKNAQYAGVYEHPGYGRVVVEEQDGALAIKMLSGVFALRGTGADRFLVDASVEYGQMIPARFGDTLENEIDTLDLQLEEMIPGYMVTFRKLK